MISLTDGEFIRLTEFMRLNYGINLTHKRSLVEGRLQNLLMELGFHSFSDYFKNVLADRTQEMITTMINKLTTNHTYFLREPEHFLYFREKVLPYMVLNAAGCDLRIWSAGCATGEEPFTLAMIIADYFGFQKGSWDTNILATDISQRALDVARAGLYTGEQMGALPKHWQKCFFKKYDENRYGVIDQIKNEVTFRRFNLVAPFFSFKRSFQVIFCKNVMIYFDQQVQQELIAKFYEITEPGGYLFIGLSETLNRRQTKYKYIMPAVYRKE